MDPIAKEVVFLIVHLPVHPIAKKPVLLNVLEVVQVIVLVVVLAIVLVLLKIQQVITEGMY